jgi:hypothetical protein
MSTWLPHSNDLLLGYIALAGFLPIVNGESFMVLVISLVAVLIFNTIAGILPFGDDIGLSFNEAVRNALVNLFISGDRLGERGEREIFIGDYNILDNRCF